MAILKDAIKTVDPAPDKKKELTLAANLLFELAEQKKKLQEEALKDLLRTAGTPENPSIPITNILEWHSETRAYVSSDAGKLVDVVTGAVKKFITGHSDGSSGNKDTDEVLTGVGELVAGGLTAILGAGTGLQSEMHSYFIVVEGLSIVRFDIMGWQRRIEATGITSVIENAMTFTGVKSSVNVDKITFNTFLQAYKKQLEKLDFSDTELLDFIKKAKDVFNILRDENATTGNDNVNFQANMMAMPARAVYLDSGRPVGETRASRSDALSASRYTYSFRLAYEVYEGSAYHGTVSTFYVPYYKGHKHGVQPRQKEIDDQLIVLIGEVDEYCTLNGIDAPDPQEIRDGYTLETKSSKG